MRRGSTARPSFTDARLRLRPGPIALDPVDKRLIEALQHDGRRPYTQLAQDVGLSEAAVRQRVRRLVEVGVTQIVAVTDPMTLGFRRMAMVGVRVEGDVRAAADTIAAPARRSTTW